VIEELLRKIAERLDEANIAEHEGILEKFNRLYSQR